MSHLLTDVLNTTLEETASINALLTYLAFLYASIGLANSSRARWEDLKLEEQSSDEPIRKRARLQASTDYHNWFGSILFISSAAEIVMVFLWLYVAMKSQWDSIVLQLAVSAFIVLGHIFCVRSYRKEVREIFYEPRTYRAFLPVKWLRAERP